MTSKGIEVSCLMKPTVESEKKIVIHRGGTRSSKSTTLLQMVLHWLITGHIGNKKDEIGVFSILRKFKASHKASTYRDFTNLLFEHGLYGAVEESKQDSLFRCGGRTVEFIGADDPQKLRSANRTHLWCEEANEITQEDFFQSSIRTTGRVFLSFNPDDEDIWIRTDLEQKRMKDKGDVEVIVSTYLDNPFLSQEVIENIEYLKETDLQYWQIYGLGEYGKLQGRVFENFTVTQGVPAEAELLGYGLDFGFNNPTALSKVWKHQNNIWLEEVIYQSGMTNKDLHNLMSELGVLKNAEIIADCEDTKSIEELKRLGWNIKEAKKGKDSVIFGIKMLMSYNIHIPETSVNGHKELRTYKWKLDKKTGKYTNEPVKLNDHFIDSCRYVAMDKLMPDDIKKKTGMSIRDQYKMFMVDKNKNKAYR